MRIIFNGERGTDYDGLTATVTKVPEGKHYLSLIHI